MQALKVRNTSLVGAYGGPIDGRVPATRQVGIYWQYLGHPDGVILACVAWHLLA
jgi:hypothetical protein